MKKNTFLKDLKIFNGIVTYDGFDIDEAIPFEEQWYAYDEDILQITFGDRFTLDVGWYPSGDPGGKFRILAILDNDWEHPLSKISARTLAELKNAIERTAIFINEMRKIKDIPVRSMQDAEWYMLSKFNNQFIKGLNILDGKIIYNCFDNNKIKKDSLDSLYEAILQIKFGDRFIMDVDWRAGANVGINSDLEGVFFARAILDNDWEHPLSKISARTLAELKNAIERTAIFINEMRKIKDIPYREIKYKEIDNCSGEVKNSDFIKSLNIIDGNIIRNNFNIDETIPLADQLNALHDNLLEIEWGSKFLLEVGWYPEKDPEGNFVIHVIKDRDWADPVFKIKCCTISSVKKSIIQAIQIINKIKNNRKLPLD